VRTVLPTAPGQPGYDVLQAGRGVLTVALGLTALGLVMVYSIGSGLSIVWTDDRPEMAERYADILARQLRWVGLGIVVGFVVARAPLETLRRVATPLLAASLGLLVLTLLLGPSIKGSRRWLVYGGFSLQASEVLKVAVLLYLADRLASRERHQAFGTGPPLLGLLLPVGAGAALVLASPDLGTSLFVVAEAVVLLGLAGVRPRRVVPMALTLLPLLVFVAYTRFPHVRSRFQMYAEGPERGSQVHSALVALGSGGLFGRGLGEGVQKLGYFPEPHNDFILAVIGEELGFVGCAAVVLAFMAFAIFGRRVAWQARLLGPHAYYLAAGATFIVAFQALMNLAVVTASTPTKGVSLPFISVGGSNLLMASACVGLILNVSRRAAAAAGQDALE
jgi:cell division protein FtsW